MHFRAHRQTASDSTRTVRSALAGRRLLFVINDLDFFVSHRLPIAVAARRAGMDVHVAAAPGPETARLHVEQIRFHPFPITRSGANPFQELRTVWSLYRLFRSLRPDLVHTVTIKPVIYGGFVGRLTGQAALVSAIPGLGSVFTEPGILAGLRRRMVVQLYRIALRHPRIKVIFQNPENCSTFLAAGLIEPGAAALIRGSGVDLGRFRASPLPQGDPIVLFASRMLWAKGVGEFVAAAKRLRAEGIAARFVIVGEPDSGNPWYVEREKLQGWHNDGTVEWWGRRDDMPEVIAQAYVFCLPSYYGEGVPKALIEAAACARPLVGTAIPGCREVIRDRDNGLLIPVRDGDALAYAIRSLLEDRIGAERMGRRSREIAEREFGIESVVSQTLEVYEDLLGSRHQMSSSRVETRDE